MFFTARQLEDLHRIAGGNGHLVLPCSARLTPMAADWVRAKKIAVDYREEQAKSSASAAIAAPLNVPEFIVGAAPMLYWCDGPCGPAKAAVLAQARESSLHPIDLPSDTRQVVPVVKLLAGKIKSGQASAGVLLVQSGGAAMVFANRCPSLRAVLGTCAEAVDQAIREVAANVLVIEYPHRTLHQVKSMLGRFARTPHVASEELHRQLQALALCG